MIKHMDGSSIYRNNDKILYDCFTFVCKVFTAACKAQWPESMLTTEGNV